MGLHPPVVLVKAAQAAKIFETGALARLDYLGILPKNSAMVFHVFLVDVWVLIYSTGRKFLSPSSLYPMYPIIAIAAELDMVILAHSTPEECAGLLNVVPNAKILMAHSGGCPTALGDWFRAIEVAKQYPNLYLDTASSQIDMGYVEAMVEGVGAERVIFGTDMPLLDPFFGLAKVTGADLTREDKEFILGKNIMRILGGSL